MPYAPEHKQETRERIVRTARRLFNRKGFSEVTIDEIMAEAGLTRGGFYRHFKTKDELYSEALLQFLCKKEPDDWQRQHVNLCAEGTTLARMIMDAYLSKDHLEDRDGPCPTAALGSDVSRSGTPVRKAFRMVLEMMLKVFTGALPGADARERALALVSLCVGAMVVARAVDDPDLADALRLAARKHILASSGWSDAAVPL
jgi:TetR/AcrR family transcriptional regulator, transcriptional repressor for nem operon